MVTKKPREDGEYLSSLERGLAVLEAFDESSPEITLSEIAALTELNPAVVRRCLNTLEHLGYVAKRDKQFFLRPEVFNLGTAYTESMHVDEIVRPVLQEIRDKTGNSTALAIMSDQEILLLAYVPTKMLTRIVAGVGTRFPTYATAGGRVLLAHQSAEKIKTHIENTQFQAFTDKTVTSKEKFAHILTKVKEDGYAAITGELDFGLVSIAVPVFNDNQQIIAAISCSAPSSITTQQKMIEKDLSTLRSTARKLEQELKQSPLLVHSIIS